MPWQKPMRYIRAVDGISFDIKPGETLSIVGESGCGKTTTARLILILERPTKGRILFKGKDIHKLGGQALHKFRGSVQAVLQDPWSSFNPRLRARSIIAEPLIVNQHMRGRQLSERVKELLSAVGMESGVANYFPHEFSGGMRQRLALARALGLNPELIILDEPVSALDVSIRAQIMNLLKEIQERLNLTYLLIAHNLATVRYLSHRVAVMYVGQILEIGTTEELFSHPLHPYTKALISAAAPIRLGENSGKVILSGEVPSPANPPKGCRFHPRCTLAFKLCSEEVPQLIEINPGHKVSCHLY